MDIVNTINGFARTKEQYYDWFYRLTSLKKLFLALLMAVIIGIAAQVRIPLFFTPVPITGQVFAVLLSGIILGHVYGGLSTVLYVSIGFAGMPWFSGAGSGLPISPTTGYILGFIPAAFLVGWLTRRYKKSRSIYFLIGIMLIAVVIIYLFGALHFSIFMRCGLINTLHMAVLPFIPVDIAKAIAAAGIARALLPAK